MSARHCSVISKEQGACPERHPMFWKENGLVLMALQFRHDVISDDRYYSCDAYMKMYILGCYSIKLISLIFLTRATNITCLFSFEHGKLGSLPGL